MRYILGILLAALLVPQLSWAAPVQCECVRYLREVMGVQVKGDAWTIQPNADIKYARAGDVLLLSYDVEHAAVILGFYEGSELWVRIAESNFYTCKPSVRVVKLTDPTVRGIFRPLSTGTL